MPRFVKIPPSISKPWRPEDFVRLKQLTDINEVYKVCLKHDPQAIYALKIVNKEPKEHEDWPMHKARIENELFVHSKVHTCRYIIGLEGCFQDSNAVYIVMEYARGGDLLGAIDRQLQTAAGISPAWVSRIYFQILEAVKQCHLAGVIHRDIKAENVLMMDDDRIKLADFGFALDTSSTTHSTMDPYNGCSIGTLDYMAPELMESRSRTHVNTPPAVTKYQYTVDIWSSGVLLFYLLSGKLPFGEPNDSEAAIKSNIRNGYTAELSVVIPTDFHRLLCRMLKTDRLKRAAIHDIIEDPVFNDCRD